MRRINLIHVNVALFAASLALLAFLASQGVLGWSLEALSLYSAGNTTTPREVGLEGAALNRLQSGGDAEEIRDLLGQALAIDPNSSAIYLLGELELREGDDEGALERFEAYLRIDPSYLPAYWRIAEIHERQGRMEDRNRTLRRGVDFFEHEVELFRPRFDDSVATNFNDKAGAVYNYYRESLALLHAALDEPAGE